MYRTNANVRPRFNVRAIVADMVARGVAATSVLTALVSGGIYENAWRENRQRQRGIARRAKHTTYFANGLNGARAVARRRRQIAAGQLTAANGLVA